MMQEFNFTPTAGLEDTNEFPDEGNPRVDIMTLLNQIKGVLNTSVKPELDAKGLKETGSLSANGYIKIPIGTQEFIIQWGSDTVSANTSQKTINFPLEYPNACLGVFPSHMFYNTNRVNWSVWVLPGVKTSFVAYPIAPETGNAPTVETKFYWFAIGY